MKRQQQQQQQHKHGTVVGEYEEKMIELSLDDEISNSSRQQQRNMQHNRNQDHHHNINTSDNCSNNGDGDNYTIRYRGVRSVSRTMDHATAQWKILLFGQLLSFLSSFGSFAQATLRLECGANEPGISSVIMYFILSFLLVPLSIHRNRQDKSPVPSLPKQQQEEKKPLMMEPQQHSKLFGIPLYTPLYIYFFASFLHLEANYLIVWSFRYTALTSVMVLDAIALPSAMILSQRFLRRRYTDIHVLGAAVCLVGTVFNVLGDWHTIKLQGNDNYHYDNEQYPNDRRRLLGDLLAITGSILYGINNVINECFVRYEGGPLEYLSCLGFCGAVLACLQTALFDRDSVRRVLWGDGGGACSSSFGLDMLSWVVIYAVSKTLLYCGSSHFLVVSESALLNISLLTSDWWSILFASVFEGLARITPSPLVWVAVTLIAGGVCVYESATKNPVRLGDREPKSGRPAKLKRPARGFV